MNELIAATMAQRGFAPTNVYSADYVEYAKTYRDVEGRIARAVVQFEKVPAIRGGGVRLAGFNVLVQAHVDATAEAVETRAPGVMHGDLFAIVEAFDTPATAPTMAFERCSTCRVPVAEYFVVDGRVLCRRCKEG